MSAPRLQFVALNSGQFDGGAPRLILATPSRQIRNVELSRRQLMQIIRSSAAALEVLDRAEGRES